MKIAIVNQHSCNRGDEAAGRAVIESLRKAFPDAYIDVLYRFPGEYPPIDKDTERVHHYPELKYKFNKKFLMLLYAEIGINMLLGFLRFKDCYIGASGKIYKKLAAADIVVCAPTGPNLGDIYRDKFYLLTLIFAVLNGKKTFMYASSAGPFNTPWLRKWVSFLFERMTAVCVREDKSFKYLQDLKLKNKNIYSSIDAAIQRKIDTSNAVKYYSEAGLTLNKRNIGITPLAYLWYPEKLRNEETQKIIEKNLAAIIDKLTENGGVNVFFFPQLFSLHENDETGRNDMPIINSIINIVKHPEFCKIIPANYDSDVQQSMISRLDCFIGMRYHSIIFSVKTAVPVIGICYEHKASGFLEKAGLKDFIITLEDFISNPDAVLEKAEYIQAESGNIKQIINKKLPELKKLSAKGTEIIKNFLEKQHK